MGYFNYSKRSTFQYFCATFLHLNALFPSKCTHTQTHTYTHKHTHTNTHTQIHKHTHTQTHTDTHTHTHTHTHTQTHTHKHTHTEKEKVWREKHKQIKQNKTLPHQSLLSLLFLQTFQRKKCLNITTLFFLLLFQCHLITTTLYIPITIFPTRLTETAGPDLLDYSNYVFSPKLNENLLIETDVRAALGNKSNIQYSV